jgi:signal transduction histidine kinase
VKKTPDDSLRGPRPALTLALLLAAAGVMLSGGAWLARRTVHQRIPADRALLQEGAATLEAELTRLDQLYLGHLQRLAQMLISATPTEKVRDAAGSVYGIAQFSVLLRKGTHPATVRVPGPGTPPPEPEVISSGKNPASAFVFPVPAETVFGGDEPGSPSAAGEGWLGKQGDVWRGWWHRLDAQYSVVFIIRSSDVRASMDRHLSQLLPAVWAPVRAAGGLDRVKGPDAHRLAGISDVPPQPPDFIVPLASRFGTWQIVSWDRWRSHTEFDLPTLAVSAALAAGLALLGWLVAGAQRRALREMTAQVTFVNRVSHELGAPLTNIGLYLELARDALAYGDKPESERRLAVATEETGRLSRLVENVLTFARSERKSLELHPLPCHPAEVVGRVLEQFAPALARRGIAVDSHMDADAETELDASALAQITANLVSNVEKYAAAGGWMRVTLTVIENTLRLSVQDRGPGIPAGESARVFLPFERLDSRLTEGVSGTGLGLAISRDLAIRMGGSVELDRPAEGGCVFVLSIPGKTSNSKLQTSENLQASSSSVPAVQPAIGI